MTDTNTLQKIERLIIPIVSDLQLDLYDLELRGGTLRVTIDRPADFEGGLDLEAIALAARLIGRELDHDDPMGGHYTLEVTSPGLERSLRVPAHFQKSLGKNVALRLRDIVDAEGQRSERRLQGVLIAADEHAVTIRLDDAEQSERSVSTMPSRASERSPTTRSIAPRQCSSGAQPRSPARARRRRRQRMRPR